MPRKLIITFHLFLAAFFIPMVLMTAVSGGLYLFKIDGHAPSEIIYSGNANEFNLADDDVAPHIRSFFEQQNIDYQFEYVVGNSHKITTRPTSRTHYTFNLKDDQLEVTRQSPDLIRSMIELHKGHGPKWFIHLQRLMALGLVFILLSGFILGITSDNLRIKTLTISGLGSLVMLVTILF